MRGRRMHFDIRQAGRHLLVALGLLAAGNLLFWALATRPAVQEFRSLTERYQPMFDRLAERRARIVEREGFLEAVRQAEADLGRFRDEVLSTRAERLVDVQAELDRLARAFGINVDRVSYRNQILEDEELDRMEMVVPLEGGYAALRRFLQAVEDSDRFLVVERVGLAQGKDGGVLLQLNITLVTYFTAPERLLKKRAERAGRRR